MEVREFWGWLVRYGGLCGGVGFRVMAQRVRGFRVVVG